MYAVMYFVRKYNTIVIVEVLELTWSELVSCVRICEIGKEIIRVRVNVIGTL